MGDRDGPTCDKCPKDARYEVHTADGERYLCTTHYEML